MFDDNSTIWNNSVSSFRLVLYIKIGHCPVVHLSIVVRAVSQCSVIIKHAFLFDTPYNSFTPHQSANIECFQILKRDLRLLLSLLLAAVECKMKKCFGICKRVLKLETGAVECPPCKC